MRLFVLAFALLCGVHINAQSTRDSLRTFKIHYAGALLSGVQAGCVNCSLSTKLTSSSYLINGVQLSKRFFTGVGVGIDSYEQWKTMPVFLHLSEKIAGRKNGLLIQLNTGYASAWLDKSINNFPGIKQEGGWMIHPAITYQLQAEKWKIFFSAGYKTQRASYSYRNEWQTFAGGGYNAFEVTNELNRVVLQIGFGWR